MVSLSNHERLTLRQAQGERAWDGSDARELVWSDWEPLGSRPLPATRLRR